MLVKVSKGLQITIPSGYRKLLGLRVGSKVELVKREDTLIIKPVGDDLVKLFDEAKRLKPKHRLSARQMDEVVENEILGQ